MTNILWGSVLDRYPNLELASPQVTDAMRQQAVEKIPAPQHCKPWIDGQKAGLVIRWPYDRTLVQFRGYETGTPYEPSMVVTPADANVARFAPGHYSILPLYVFKTPPGIGLYVTGLPDRYRSPIPQDNVERGILETDWYPSPPFFVFKIGVPINTDAGVILEYGDPLCMVVPVVLNPVVLKMEKHDVDAMIDEHCIYSADKIDRDDLLWMTQDGKQMFSHIYKERSAQFRDRQNT